jgi:hypothetical protein
MVETLADGADFHPMNFKTQILPLPHEKNNINNMPRPKRPKPYLF